MTNRRKAGSYLLEGRIFPLFSFSLSLDAKAFAA